MPFSRRSNRIHPQETEAVMSNEWSQVKEHRYTITRTGKTEKRNVDAKVKLLIFLIGGATKERWDIHMEVFMQELLQFVYDNNVELMTQIKSQNCDEVKDNVNFFNGKTTNGGMEAERDTQNSEIESRISRVPSEKVSESTPEPKLHLQATNESIEEVVTKEEAAGFKCVVVTSFHEDLRETLDETLALKKPVPVIFIEVAGVKAYTMNTAEGGDETSRPSTGNHSCLLNRMKESYKSKNIGKSVLKALARGINHDIEDMEDRNLVLNSFAMLCLSIDHFEIAVQYHLFNKAIHFGEKPTKETEKFLDDLSRLVQERWLPVQETEEITGFGQIKKIADQLSLEFLEKPKPKDANEDSPYSDVMEVLFKLSLKANKYKCARALWNYVKNPTAAALIAFGILNKEKSSKNEEEFLPSMKKFQHLSVEFIGRCYASDDRRTFDILQQSLPLWGSKDCIEIALASENQKFLSQPACIEYNQRIWYFNKTHLDYTERTVLQRDNGVSRFLQLLICLLSRKITDVHTPIIRFAADTVGLLFNLLVCGWFLVYELRVEDIKWQEYLFWAYIFPLLLQQCRQIKSQGWAYFKRFYNWLDLLSIVFFIVAFVIRIAVDVTHPSDLSHPTELSESLTSCARIIYSLDFIFFLLRFLEKYEASDFLGPLLTTIRAMVWTLIQFLLILGLLYAAVAVASQAVMYPNSGFESVFPMMQRTFYYMFGELSLETFQNSNCTFDPQLYTNNTKDRCVTEESTYFVPVLLAFFLFAVNILLFNLLIAKFNTTIIEYELRSLEIWHCQMCRLTIEYSESHILPIPFLFFSSISRLVRCCRDGKIASSPNEGREQGNDLMKFEDMEREKYGRYLTIKKSPRRILKGVGDETKQSDFVMYVSDESEDDDDEYTELFNMIMNWEFLKDNDEALQTDGDTGGPQDEQRSEHSEPEIPDGAVTLPPPQREQANQPEPQVQKLAEDKVGKTATDVIDFNILTSHIIQRLKGELRDTDVLAVCKEIRSILRSRDKEGKSGTGGQETRPRTPTVTIPEQLCRDIAKEVAKLVQSAQIRPPLRRREHMTRLPYVNMDSRYDQEAATVILRQGGPSTSTGDTGVGKLRPVNQGYYVMRRRYRYGLVWKWFSAKSKKMNGKRKPSLETITN